MSTSTAKIITANKGIGKLVVLRTVFNFMPQSIVIAMVIVNQSNGLCVAFFSIQDPTADELTQMLPDCFSILKQELSSLFEFVVQETHLMLVP